MQSCAEGVYRLGQVFDGEVEELFPNRLLSVSAHHRLPHAPQCQTSRQSLHFPLFFRFFPSFFLSFSLSLSLSLSVCNALRPVSFVRDGKQFCLSAYLYAYLAIHVYTRECLYWCRCL